jgi:hypothetical protein
LIAGVKKKKLERHSGFYTCSRPERQIANVRPTTECFALNKSNRRGRVSGQTPPPPLISRSSHLEVLPHRFVLLPRLYHSKYKVFGMVKLREDNKSIREKVGLNNCHSLREVSFVNHAKRRGSRELGPVGRLGKSLEVLADERVGRCTGICVRVCEGDSRMVDGASRAKPPDRWLSLPPHQRALFLPSHHLPSHNA